VEVQVLSWAPPIFYSHRLRDVAELLHAHPRAVEELIG
jgi:hypothetical protein